MTKKSYWNIPMTNKYVNVFFYLKKRVHRYSGTHVPKRNIKIKDLNLDSDYAPTIDKNDRKYLHIYSRSWIEGDQVIGNVPIVDHDCILVASQRENPDVDEIIQSFEKEYGQVLHLKVVLSPKEGSAFGFNYYLYAKNALYTLPRDLGGYWMEEHSNFRWHHKDFIGLTPIAFVLRDRRWIKSVGNFGGPSLADHGIRDGDSIVFISYDDRRPAEVLEKLIARFFPAQEQTVQGQVIDPRLESIAKQIICCQTVLPSHTRLALSKYKTYFLEAFEKLPSRSIEVIMGDVTGYVLKELPLPKEEPSWTPVRLGISAPAQARPGTSFILRFVAYLPELQELVERQLKKQSPKSNIHLDRDRFSWKVGTCVKVCIYGDYLDVSPRDDQFEWNGEKCQLDFEVAIRADAEVEFIILRADVYLEGIRISRMRLNLDLIDSTQINTERTLHFQDSPHLAFASYSIKDRLRVLDRVATLVIHTGMEVFMDCVTLRPNQKWRKLIPQFILESDVLLLFWSENAAASEWVNWEWRHALSNKGLEGIEVHPLSFARTELPEELKELQFSDIYMVFREWEEERTRSGH